jgi:ubiquinone/menaquinone biosynthesis C-methylase UbiE
MHNISNEQLKKFPIVISGQSDIIRQSLYYPFETILDIGAGNGGSSLAFLECGKTVSATGLNFDTYASQNLIHSVKTYEDLDVCNMNSILDQSYEAVWCAHVLEHVLDTGKALNEIHRVLKDDGWLFLSVPPFKSRVVGGHVSVGWNIGLLAYVLAIAGFNSRDGSYINHGYNITAFVQKSKLPQLKLRHDHGDIDKLKDFLPEDIVNNDSFEGNIRSLNWNWKFPKSELLLSPKMNMVKFFLSEITPPFITKIRSKINHEKKRN